MPITLRIPPQIDEATAKELVAEALGNHLHEQEADAKGATIDNYGWGVNADGAYYNIASKTDKGILRTDINVETGLLEHLWIETNGPEGDDE